MFTTPSITRPARKGSFHSQQLASYLGGTVKSLSVLALLAMATTTQAATINWLSTSNISGDTDVISSSGSLFTALNFGSSTSTTVDGVTFVGFAFAGAGAGSTIISGDGNLSFSSDSGFSAYDSFGSSSPPFSNLSTNYQTLLSTGVYGNSGTYTFTTTLHNLTVGDQYAYQFWSNDSRDGQPNRSMGQESGGPNVGAAAFTIGNSSTGQYGVGTFTADSTNQSISVFGNGYMNAVQVQDLSGVSSAPEPSRMLLALVGVGCMSLRRRRKQAA